MGQLSTPINALKAYLLCLLLWESIFVFLIIFLLILVKNQEVILLLAKCTNWSLVRIRLSNLQWVLSDCFALEVKFDLL